MYSQHTYIRNNKMKRTKEENDEKKIVINQQNISEKNIEMCGDGKQQQQ